MVLLLATIISVSVLPCFRGPYVAVAQAATYTCVPRAGGEPERAVVESDVVAPGGLRGRGVAILAGSDFFEEAYQPGARVAIINEEFAKRYYANFNPIGMTLGIGPQCRGDELKIVGVVPNPPKGSRLANSPIVYVPAKGK